MSNDTLKIHTKPLSIKLMLSYGSGQTGAQIFRDAAALPLFMTTMLGVSPWLAGVVILNRAFNGWNHTELLWI